MYQIKVNNKFDFAASRSDGTLIINDQPTDADISPIGDFSYHIIHNLKSYNTEVVSFDKATKTAEIKVNGQIYTLTAKNQFDVLLEQLGFNIQDSAKVSEIKAPMPGLVLKIFVAEGDVVQKGDSLFVLEAMKMENMIKAPADVTIKAIKMKSGDKVEKGQVLMLF